MSDLFLELHLVLHEIQGLASQVLETLFGSFALHLFQALVHRSQGWLSLEHRNRAIFVLMFGCKRRILLVFDFDKFGFLLVTEASKDALACLD